jgi:hypothetical protein
MCNFIYFLCNCKIIDGRSSVYVTIDCWAVLLFREVIHSDFHAPFSASAVRELLLSYSQAVLQLYIGVVKWSSLETVLNSSR